MKTALDWYCKEINYLTINYKIGNIDENEYLIKQVEIYNQAKQMQKEQMCKFAYKCHNHYKVYGDFKIEEYYNETFKSE